jgi:dihydrodipicolinate synthase/N-acetylneuraminate lyase
MKYDAADAREWARATLRGHIVTTLTPFADDLTLDETALRTQVDELLRLECTGGLYVNSVIGEVQSLTVAERDRALAVVVDQVGGRVPVVAVTPGNAVPDVVAAVERARLAGADLVMLWPPTFGYRTPEGVLRFLSEIADSARIGLCLYASGLSEFGFRITTGMLRSLLPFPAICAVKEASMSLSGYLETLGSIGDDLLVSCPLDEYWATGRRMLPGKAPDVLLGTSRPLYMETDKAPHLSRLRSAVNGDGPIEAELSTVLAVAGRLHTRFLEAGGHNLALIKAMAAARGLPAGPVRPPMSPPDPDAVTAGTDIMRQHGLLG